MSRSKVLTILSLLLPMSTSSLLCDVLARSRPYPGEATSEIRRALNALPNLSDFRVPREERMKPLRALLERYPRDLFIQHRYQETFRRSLHLYEEFDRAFATYRSKPDDPIFRYLEARLTGSLHAQKAEQMLNELIAKEPGFPWPHLAIAELTERPGGRDAKKAEHHLRVFLGACPASVEGYALLRTVEDPEMIRSGASKLRPLLEARMDVSSLPYWRYLWDLELRAAPKEEREAVRQHVLKDVAALRKLTPAPTREQNKYQRDPSMFPEEMRKRAESDAMELTRWRVGLTLADLYLYQKNADLAREAIEIGQAEISPSDRSVEFRRREWLPRQARLALLEGDRERALSLFRQYLTASPRAVFTGQVIPGLEMADTIAEAKALYLANGGKEESWVEWATSGPKDPALTSKPATLEYTRLLADFEAKDLNGKTWRLADLKGKATFIDIWATWCGPCRAEHPELQKLREKIKDRKDIQVLTFSLDETAYLAEAYMKEHKYTFPVIVSKNLLERLFPAGGLPQGWIIDSQGRRSSYFRFPGVERTLAELERAAGKEGR